MFIELVHEGVVYRYGDHIMALNRKRFYLRFFYQLGLFEFLFYWKAFLWHLTHKVPDTLTINELFEVFYHSFMKVPIEDVEVVEKSTSYMIIKSHHDCLFLRIAKEINIDTKVFCRNNSMRPCRYFMRKLGKQYVVENDYEQIRPRLTACRETLRIIDQW